MKKLEMNRIKPVHAFSYIGGKSRYINKLYEEFPKSYTSFYDVCGGSGVVTFSMDFPSDCNKVVLNDYDPTIYNFYATLKGKRGKELEKRLLEFDYSSLNKIDWCGYNASLENFAIMDEVEASICTYIQIMSSFSGMRKDYVEKPKEKLKSFAAFNIPLIRERLQNIHVSNRDFIEILEEIESSDAFVYIDVPYRMETREGSALYKYELEEEKHDEMLQILRNAPFKWALSGYREEGLLEPDKYDIRLSQFAENTVVIPTWKFGANKKVENNMFEESYYGLGEEFASGGKPKVNEILWRNYQ